VDAWRAYGGGFAMLAIGCLLVYRARKERW
jgi:hypothetical protein